MKIILTEDVSNLGQDGDVVDVADGYARNYLIPQGMAAKATPGAVKQYEQRKAAEARQAEKMAARAEELADRLSGVTVIFEAKAGETGRLYGSITTDDIAEALERETGETFDRRKQILSEPLRELGEHTVSVRLSPDVIVEVKALVQPEDGEMPVEISEQGESEQPEDAAEAS